MKKVFPSPENYFILDNYYLDTFLLQKTLIKYSPLMIYKIPPSRHLLETDVYYRHEST